MARADQRKIFLCRGTPISSVTKEGLQKEKNNHTQPGSQAGEEWEARDTKKQIRETTNEKLNETFAAFLRRALTLSSYLKVLLFHHYPIRLAQSLPIHNPVHVRLPDKPPPP